MAKSQSPLARLLSTPDLPAIVPRLPPDVLHRVIQAWGLEDCSELVALATPGQLERVFDVDLWRSPAAGSEEHFDADRFAAWLAVLLEAGPEVAAEKLAGIDVGLVVAGFSQHIVASDHAAVSSYETLDGEHRPGRAPTRSREADIGGYSIEARRTSAWDVIVELLAFLAAEHVEYFHRLMRGCVRLSNSRPEEDASHALLEDAAQHLFDLGLEREARRERQGFLTPAQAHAFLRGGRDLNLEGDRPQPSAITRAYFRAFDPVLPDHDEPTTAAAEDGRVEAAVAESVALLRDAGVLAPPARALLETSDSSGSQLVWIESYVAGHSESAQELAFLANAVLAGCALQGRPFSPKEAGDVVAATCNLGLENWPPHWGDPELLSAFQVGWTVLHRDACLHTSKQVIAVLGEVACGDRETFLALDRLRRDLLRHVAGGEPWRARPSLDVILTFDAPAWAALAGLIDECPVLHGALEATQRRRRAIRATDFRFIARNSDIGAVRAFLADLPALLTG